MLKIQLQSVASYCQYQLTAFDLERISSLLKPCTSLVTLLTIVILEEGKDDIGNNGSSDGDHDHVELNPDQDIHIIPDCLWVFFPLSLYTQLFPFQRAISFNSRNVLLFISYDT